MQSASSGVGHEHVDLGDTDQASNLAYLQDLHNLLNNPVFELVMSTFQQQPLNPNTPVQQTRYGRISRPPIQPPVAVHSALREVVNADTHAQAPESGAVQVQKQAQAGSVPLPVTAVGKRSREEETPQVPITQAEVVPSPPVEPQLPNRGGRPSLPNEEKIARRRERNKQSALEWRRKKKQKLDDTESLYLAKSEECEELGRKVRELENYIVTLQTCIRRNGIAVPGEQGPTPTQAKIAESVTPRVGPVQPLDRNRIPRPAAPMAQMPVLPPIAELSGQANPHMPVPMPMPVALPLPGAEQPVLSPAVNPLAALHSTPASYVASSPLNDSGSVSRGSPGAGTPSTHPLAQLTPAPAPDPNFISGPGSTHPLAQSTPMPDPNFFGGDGYNEISLSALFDFEAFLDENDANDADFVPPTSPTKNGDDDESSDESDFEEEGRAGRGRASRGRRRTRESGRGGSKDKARSAKRSRTAYQPEDNENENENYEEDGDADMDGDDADADTFQPEAEDEEEDLFLPIVDVPIPIDQLYQETMDSLGVASRAELATVARKIVETAAHGGLTGEQVEGLRRLVRLAEAQGMYASVG